MNSVTGKIIGAAIDVHNATGPGLLESSYKACLTHEFVLREIHYLREVPLPLVYKGMKLDIGYRLDFLIEDVVLEIKSVEAIDPIHVAQVITYMKLGSWKLGLLINFNVTSLSRGIRRIVF